MVCRSVCCRGLSCPGIAKHPPGHAVHAVMSCPKSPGRQRGRVHVSLLHHTPTVCKKICNFSSGSQADDYTAREIVSAKFEATSDPQPCDSLRSTALESTKGERVCCETSFSHHLSCQLSHLGPRPLEQQMAPRQPTDANGSCLPEPLPERILRQAFEDTGRCCRSGCG